MPARNATSPLTSGEKARLNQIIDYAFRRVLCYLLAILSITLGVRALLTLLNGSSHG